MSRNPVTRTLILGLVTVGIALVPVVAQGAPRHGAGADSSWSLAGALRTLWTAICDGEGTGADPNKKTQVAPPTIPPADAATASQRADAGGGRPAFSNRAVDSPVGRRR